MSWTKGWRSLYGRRSEVFIFVYVINNMLRDMHIRADPEVKGVFQNFSIFYFRK